MREWGARAPPAAATRSRGGWHSPRQRSLGQALHQHPIGQRRRQRAHDLELILLCRAVHGSLHAQTILIHAVESVGGQIWQFYNHTRTGNAANKTEDNETTRLSVPAGAGALGVLGAWPEPALRQVKAGIGSRPILAVPNPDRRPPTNLPTSRRYTSCLPARPHLRGGRRRGRPPLHPLPPGSEGLRVETFADGPELLAAFRGRAGLRPPRPHPAGARRPGSLRQAPRPRCPRAVVLITDTQPAIRARARARDPAGRQAPRLRRALGGSPRTPPETPPRRAETPPRRHARALPQPA